MKTVYVHWDETITYRCENSTNRTIDIVIVQQHVDNGTDIIQRDIIRDYNRVFAELTLPASVIFGNESSFELYCEVTTYTGFDSDSPQIFNRTRFVLNNTGEYAYVHFDCTRYNVHDIVYYYYK
jgi:hypothetical protein